MPGAIPAGPDLALAVLAIACLTASWLDLRYRRLPNWLCGITAASGLAFAAWSGGAVVLGSHALHLVAATALGMLLFRLGVFGGGDAKFYGAVAAWLPLARFVHLLVAICLAGLVLLAVWFVYRRIRGYPIRVQNATIHDGLPYGIAIGSGVLAIATSPLHQVLGA